MQISVTRHFSSWASQDESLQRLEVQRDSPVKSHTKEQIRMLRSIGMTSKSLSLLYGQIQNSCETGFASFEKMRFLCWYWGNGDKIVFPLNSKNQLYLGNDSNEWCNYWPFLEQINLNTFYCNLRESDCGSIRKDSREYILGVGGQSHFGHFIVNRVAALYQSVLAHPYLSTRNKLLVPLDYIDLHRFILSSMIGDQEKEFEQLPSKAGIYSVERVIIPCIDEHPDAILGLKGVLEQKHKNRPTTKGKRMYITRAANNQNDRIYNFKSFSETLRQIGFEIINPVELSAIERLDAIGDSELILTDSGSCSLNGLLFGNKNSIVKTMIPKRVLSSTESTVINQLCMGFNQGAEGYWLPLKSQTLSQINPWYDVCEQPSSKILEEFFIQKKIYQRQQNISSAR